MNYTPQEALELFRESLEIFRGRANTRDFHDKIAASNMEKQAQKFFLCLCNDFEDLKLKFFEAVREYVEKNPDKINRKNFNEYCWKEKGVLFLANKVTEFCTKFSTR